MMLTDVTGLCGHASALAACALLVPAVRRLSLPRISLLLAAIFIFALVPLNGLPLAGYTRGMVGDFSISSVLLIGLAILRPYGILVSEKSRLHLLRLIALVALIFYPMTLGVTLYDPYRLGYGDAGFFSVVLLVALLTWWRQSNLIVLSIALATLAWCLGAYESSNAWDYLIDPLLAGYALLALLQDARRRAKVGAPTAR
ncbi:MAG: hypothetical protein PXX73_09125 [Sideroxydans sp.]|nr:hypothetical protein [Sideroxydans sp.]